MARSSVLKISDILETGKTGFADGRSRPFTRLDFDGQNGLTTDLRALNANTPYVRQPILCFLLEAPNGFSFFDADGGGTNFGKRLTASLKCLLETKANKIDGLDSTISAEYAETPNGPSEVMHTFTRSVRARSEPSFEFTELSGMAITDFIDMWITMLLGDPITGVPGVVTLGHNLLADGQYGDSSHHTLTPHNAAFKAYVLMPENTSATCLFVEPDNTFTYPVNAWLVANMMPDKGGDRTGARDRTSAPDILTFTTKFTGIQEVNQGVMNLAADVLRTINKRGLNSRERRAYIGDTYAEAIGSTSSKTRFDNRRHRRHVVDDAKAILPEAVDIGGTKSSEIKLGVVEQAHAIATYENQANMQSRNYNGTTLSSSRQLAPGRALEY